MRFKLFILSVLTAEAFLATAAPVVLKNPSLSLTVLPECGGKIVSLKSGESAFILPEDVRHLPAYGLAKEHFFNDDFSFAKASIGPHGRFFRISKGTGRSWRGCSTRIFFVFSSISPRENCGLRPER